MAESAIGTDPIFAVLETFVGEPVTSISFVKDYLQIRLNEKNLLLYAWPVFTDGTARIDHSAEAFADALRRLIGHKMSSYYFEDATLLELVFDDNVRLAIQLSREAESGLASVGDSQPVYDF